MICVIVVLLLVHSVSSIPIGDFLPFNGPNVCLFDTVTMLVHKSNTIGSDGLPIDEVNRRDCEEFRLSPNDDGSSPNISIGFTFPFFARRFRNLYVNTNGVISFIQPVPQFSPDPFPIDKKYLISPYWADVDIRGIGDVYFKETTNSSLLAQANDIIQSATTPSRGLSRFKPRWMLIATWYNVGYFSTHTDMANTFQALLVTDGRHSFVVFNYLDDGISWTRGDASQVDAQVGFNFGGEDPESYVFPTSRTAAIADIEEDHRFNTGSPGQYVYRVDSATIKNITTNGSGCDELPILLDPDTPSIINGGVMTLSGPSFNKSTEHDDVVCVFYDEDGDVTEFTKMMSGATQRITTSIKGIIVNCKAICPMPLFRKLGQHRLNVTVKNRSFFGEFEVVPAVFKTPDVHIYDGDGELEFAVIDNEKTYMARWNSAQIKKDQFKENGTITFTLENWVFFLGKRWQKRGGKQTLFSIVHTDYDNGNVTFQQKANKPRKFQFDISVIVLVKRTKNLNITYTSSILSFALKLFGQFTRESALLEYCSLWFAESSEIIERNALQTCPCTVEAVRFDPDFISDPTCSSTSSKCHENVNATHCYLKSITTMSLGQQCCYDAEGKYITTNTPAGSADFYFPTQLYLQHQSSDYFPYKTCCIDTNDPEFCEKYYGKRPKDNGTGCTPAPPNRGNGGGRGDPHFITLDGVQYTFNGLGEYTLLDAHNGDFVINILTKQAEETGGSLIPATSISVIAMKMRNRPVIQAQLDEIFGIKLLVESNMTETGYRELEFEFVPVRNFDGGHVEVEEEFSRNFMLENGVVIVIKASNDILSFQLSIPHSFRDNTKGLLGVWNGNQSDDFLRPDGTTFSIDSSEEEIFDNFGEKWGVDESNSLIIIEEGYTRPVKDESFKPLFMTPVVDETTQMMIDATCGNNSRCAFDIAVTGIVEVGRTTLIEIEEQMTIINQSLPIVCDPPCQNNAPCVANDTCNCNTGFTGNLCESEIIQCDTPCENGGTCTRLERCSCLTGYFGQYCTIYNPCVGSPCEQECIIGRDGYTCQCSDGYFLAADNISCVKCAEAKTRGGVDPTWHVALCDANTNEMMCSGTAINDQWILTSAGCVCNGLDRQSLSIRFGKNRTCFHRERREVRLSASEIYCYSNYKAAKLSLDFALIKLQSAIPVRNVKRSPPLCLSRQVRSTVLPGQKVLIYGWGRVGEEVPEDAVLQSSGMVTIANLSECMTEFNSDGIKGTPERMICTMANTTSACSGNYGSAVITNTKNKLFLTAVVSKSTKSCGTDRSFLIHSKTRNLNFIKWINNITVF